ncbi:phospholipid-binding lipoprotein MlaA [Pseudomonas sp. NFACC09-4]|jgi:phospholipid-binding lipoprotein MlaA|uniref:MlaA family lipoprotein n=1 Tax=unclassified Pseudomonas TaxID=196821 RepID=UPI000908BD67|nr:MULTISPECIES: VacJ family lipoprotein [unclassified Pseudomonas]ROO36621.1 ABC transporter [Pseudomonas sp. AF76]SFW55818.1 phospholipid-binding lipoprotein MlaA [Pseudomonas sp. NFACC09-4]
MPKFKPAPLRVGFSLVIALAALASGCTSTPAAKPGSCESVPYTVHDPAQPINRGIFAFNRTVDDYALAPMAREYRKLPEAVQTGVHNFVANFGEPKVFINDLLQGNAQRSVNTLGRFVINSTAGIVGLIDVSGKLGIERHKADFGQTFGVWNLAPGPIVELPLLGTANLRDATGKVVGFVVDPFAGDSDTLDTLGTINTAGGIVDGRAQALPQTDQLRTQPDYYVALRDAVAQQRADFVAQGKLGAVTPQCAQEQADD